MKHNTNRPQGDNKNGTFNEDDLATSNKIQQHLVDKNNQISDEDFVIASGPSEENLEEVTEDESNRLATKITEEDLDDEGKSGLESPWNIFS